MGTRRNNVIMVKSMDFAIRIVNLYKYLCSEKQEYVMSKQLLKSGTSIGANVREADEGISRADFLSKIYIALKEARETGYWIELLYRTDYLTLQEYQSVQADCLELVKILATICKTVKGRDKIEH